MNIDQEYMINDGSLIFIPKKISEKTKKVTLHIYRSTGQYPIGLIKFDSHYRKYVTEWLHDANPTPAEQREAIIFIENMRAQFRVDARIARSAEPTVLDPLADIRSTLAEVRSTLMQLQEQQAIQGQYLAGIYEFMQRIATDAKSIK